MESNRIGDREAGNKDNLKCLLENGADNETLEPELVEEAREIIKHIILDKNCFIMYVILCKLYKGG